MSGLKSVLCDAPEPAFQSCPNSSMVRWYGVDMGAKRWWGSAEWCEGTEKRRVEFGSAFCGSSGLCGAIG